MAGDISDSVSANTKGGTCALAHFLSVQQQVAIAAHRTWPVLLLLSPNGCVVVQAECEVVLQHSHTVPACFSLSRNGALQPYQTYNCRPGPMRTMALEALVT